MVLTAVKSTNHTFPQQKMWEPLQPGYQHCLETLARKALLLHPRFCGDSPALLPSPTAERFKILWSEVEQGSKCRGIFVSITWSRLCCLCWMREHLLRACERCFRVYFPPPQVTSEIAIWWIRGMTSDIPVSALKQGTSNPGQQQSLWPLKTIFDLVYIFF